MKRSHIFLCQLTTSETTENLYSHLFFKKKLVAQLREAPNQFSLGPTYHNDGQLLGELYKAATVATL